MRTIVAALQDSNGHIRVVCSDGTAWALRAGTPGEWVQVGPPIPQPQAAAT